MWTLLCCFNSQKSTRLETQELNPGAPPDQRGPNHLSIAATPGACTSRKLESKAEATRMRAFPRARQTLPAQHFQQVFRWVLSYYSSKSRINAEVPVPLRIIYTQGAQVPWDTTYGFAAAETLSHTDSPSEVTPRLINTTQKRQSACSSLSYISTVFSSLTSLSRA